MKHKILLCLDYDEETGLGHVSRSKAFIEAASIYSPEIYICSKLNPKVHEPQIDFLEDCHWLTQIEAEQITFSLIYIDVYNYKFLDSVKYWPAQLKVVLLDGNFSGVPPMWADIIIDLEKSFPRDIAFKNQYLFGNILVDSKIEQVRSDMSKLTKKEDNVPNNRVAINFGGSAKVASYLQRLVPTIVGNEDFLFTLYCPSILVEPMKFSFSGIKNVEIKEFSSEYIMELPRYDLLITNSGTSFLEGLYLNIPMVSFNLFSNAEENFFRFKSSRLVLYSGLVGNLDDSWFAEAISELQNRFQLRTLNYEIKSDLVWVSTSDIRSALRNIFL